MTSTTIPGGAAEPAVASPVTLRAVDAPGQPTPSPELEELYRGFEAALLVPLWTEIGDLMPTSPRRDGACRTCGAGRPCCALARARRASWCPVGRGGERRAIALANPGLGGAPYATPTLWAAIQYLGPREDAPGAPPHPERLPVRRRGRGRVDGRQRRPGRDAPRRLPAHPRLALPRPPQPAPTRRWPGSTGWTSRSSHYIDSGFFEFGPERGERRRHAGRLALRAAVGASRPAPAVGLGRDSASSPHRRLPLGAHRRRAAPSSSRWRTRATPACSSRGTPRSASPTRPPAATSCRRSAPRSTGCAPGARTATRREVGSVGVAGVRRHRRGPGRRARVDASGGATCSPCRRGCR